MKSIENERAIIVGKHLDSLLIQSGITISGLAYAIEMSPNHLRTIRNGKASISSRTAGKISDFFDIEISQLFAKKSIKLKNIKNISSIYLFYKENEGNPKFFTSRRNESSLMYFLRNELLKSDFLKKERDVKEIRDYCKKSYQSVLTSKALSAQLLRLANEGLINRYDKFGNGSVYLYSLKK